MVETISLRFARLAWTAGVLLALGPAIGCGKRGAPLAPLIRVPAAPMDFTGRRVGGEVHLKLTIPQANGDGTRPADIESLTIYGFTGVPASGDDFAKRGTVVAQFDVRRPPPPLPADATAPPLPPPSGPGVDQGSAVSVVEPLTPAVMTPILPKTSKRPPPPPPEPSSSVLALPLAGPPPDVPLARVYVAIGTNHKGQKGGFSPRLSVPLVDPPSPPAKPTITYTETAVTVAWTPPANARQAAQVPTMAAPVPGVPSAPVPAAAVAPVNDPSKPLPSHLVGLASLPSMYNVYDVNPDEPKDGPDKPSALPTPLNPAPLAAAAYQDPRMDFGSERCYAVRTVNVYGAAGVESLSSEPACVKLVDTFPPAAPKNLGAVASTGVVNLMWTPNTEGDLAGYVVLRGDAASDTLQPLVQSPITEYSYSDRTAQPGVFYSYAVIAIDKAGNASAQSNRVKDAAR